MLKTPIARKINPYFVLYMTYLADDHYIQTSSKQLYNDK